MDQPGSTSLVSSDSPLWTLAFDHRNSFRRTFFGITGTPTAEQDERCRRAKGVIFGGALMAVTDGIQVGRAAVLVDEEYGADVIRRAREHGIATAVPVEASGRAELAFDHGDDLFGPAIERVQPTYAKVLVRYNPDGDAELNTRQRLRLASLQHWVVEHGRQWMLELLVPPTPTQLGAVGDDIARYDDELRPGLSVRAAQELTGACLAPDLWKLEGMAASSQYAEIAAACGADGLASACLVLGRGADEAAVDRWLSLAAPVRGFAGFAVGRTLWWEPLRSFVSGEASAPAAAAMIAGNYRRLIGVYAAARPHGSC